MIRRVVDAFGERADDLVFIGGCVLALHARPSGAPLRTTADVDCLSSAEPWAKQAAVLADLCQRRRLTPDTSHAFRYRVVGTTVDVDVLSPDGLNVPKSTWFRRAILRAALYPVGNGRLVRAATPPYLLGMKLEAFIDRGPDALSSKDAEDMVALAVEVPSLVADVRAEGIDDEVAALWGAAFAKYALHPDDLGDLVDGHLHRDDRAHRRRVVEALAQLTTAVAHRGAR